MADCSVFTIKGNTFNVKDATARTQLGNLSSLTTTDKTSAVAAINEVKSDIPVVTYNGASETITVAKE